MLIASLFIINNNIEEEEGLRNVFTTNNNLNYTNISKDEYIEGRLFNIQIIVVHQGSSITYLYMHVKQRK